MEYLLYQKDYHIAPYFECLEDEYIDIYKHPFIDPNLDDNRDVVVGVIKYLKTNNTKFLDINKKLVANIFNYLGCDEGYVLNILLSDDYQNIIKNLYIFDYEDINDFGNISKNINCNIIKLQNYNQKLLACYQKTINMFNYLNINNKYINNDTYIKCFSDLNTDENIYCYFCKNINDLKNFKLKNLKFLILNDILIEKNILPKLLISLNIYYDFNQSLKKGILPESLKILKLEQGYNKLLKKDALPKSLTILKLGYIYNQPIEKGVLPKSLKTLELGNNYNKSFFKDSLPESLTTLKLSRHYNKPFEKGVLPKSLKELYIGDKKNIY